MKGKLHFISRMVFLGIVITSGCRCLHPEPVIEPEQVIEPEGPIGPNPAEVYCIGLGYEFTTRERKINKPESQHETPVESPPDTLEVPQPGIPEIPDYIHEVVCIFPDGNECKEEEFWSGLCGQEYSYCVQQGYTLEPGQNSATCVFPDGSSCPEYEFFKGDCSPATN